MKTTRSVADASENRHSSSTPDGGKNACLRLALVFAAVLFCLVSVAGPIWADCPDQHRDCITDHGKGKNVGKVTITQCWDGWKWRCEFCGGDKQAVKNCQKKYPDQCQDKCWSCDGGKHGCCMDKEGHTHGDCSN